jgi:hypothetical protein
MKNEGAAVKFLGTTDDVTSCDCCGRSDLKSTVALSFDEAEPVYFGVVCAAKALGRDGRYIKSEARKADALRAEQDATASRLAFEAEARPWFSFLASNGKGADTFTQIQSLGGYKLARAAFEASL